MKTDGIILLQRVTMFCAWQPCFANWSPETLVDYVCFHARNCTVFINLDDGDNVRGVAFAWGCPASDIHGLWRTALCGAHFCQWKPSQDDAEYVFIAEVAAMDLKALRDLSRQLVARWPDWRKKQVWTFRRKVIHRIPPAVIEHFTRTEQTFGHL